MVSTRVGSRAETSADDAPRARLRRQRGAGGRRRQAPARRAVADRGDARRLLRIHPPDRVRQGLPLAADRRRAERRHGARRRRDPRHLGPDLDLRALGEPRLRARARRAEAASRDRGEVRPRRAERGRDRLLPRSSSSLALGITFWAARRTRTTEQFYAAGHSVTGFQNGLALAGDYMSAASFLGIAGLVALTGFDGLIYSIGFLVGWPIVMFLIAEPLRNLGRYTFADVVAFRMRQTPVRLVGRGRDAVGRGLLPDRADGRSRDADQPHLRAPVRALGRRRRRRDADAARCSAA